MLDARARVSRRKRASFGDRNRLHKAKILRTPRVRAWSGRELPAS